jgi:FHA domain
LLTTLFGTAQLALQDELRRNLDAADSTPRAPNFVVVTLRPDRFAEEHRGETEEQVERFRRELEMGMRAFLDAHGWIVGGSGTAVINIVFRELVEDCHVDARIVRSFYTLAIEDDRGARTVEVGSNPTTIGREHQPHPRGFVPVHDSLKLVSREHMVLTYRDLTLHARLLGRNPTTLNNVPLDDASVVLHDGDVIVCGACEIRVGETMKYEI